MYWIDYFYMQLASNVQISVFTPFSSTKIPLPRGVSNEGHRTRLGLWGSGGDGGGGVRASKFKKIC